MKTSKKISLKKANFFNIEFLWYLRNQLDVYQYSRQNRKVSWSEHVNWVIPVILRKTGKDLFVIQKGLLPIGQIRFDYENNYCAQISIAILKEFRGKGVGTKSFGEALKRLKKDKKIKNILAEVHKNNISSQKFFEKLNFKLKTKKGKWLKYILKL